MKGVALVFAGACALCALAGAIAAAADGHWSYTHAIAWAMWIGGALIVLLVGQSGSPSRMSGESRVLVGLGGRFSPGSDLALPQSPFWLVPLGAAVIGVGALVYIFL